MDNRSRDASVLRFFSSPMVNQPTAAAVLQQKKLNIASFQAPQNGITLSKIPFKVPRNKAPLRDIPVTPTLNIIPSKEFERIASASPCPVLSRFPSMTSDSSIQTPGLTDTSTPSLAALSFSNNSLSSSSTYLSSELNPYGNSTRASIAYGSKEKNKKALDETSSSGVFFPDSDVGVHSFKPTRKSRADSQIVDTTFNTTPSPPKVQVSAIKTSTQENKASSPQASLENLNCNYDAQSDYDGTKKVGFCTPPSPQTEEAPAKLSSDLFVDEVSFDANLFDTSIDDFETTFPETDLLTEPVIQPLLAIEPETPPLAPDLDAYLDSIASNKVSSPARPRAKQPLAKNTKKSKATAKPRGGIPKKVVSPKKPRHVPRSCEAEEKDGLLIVTTRSGRQSHRPLKLWENEKGPVPVISIKYSFMKVGVSITKDGVTERIAPVERGKKRETNIRPSPSEACQEAPPKPKATALSTRSKRSREEILAHEAINSTKKAAASKNLRKKPCRVSFKKQSLGLISPGILSGRKVGRPKTKSLAKKPKSKDPSPKLPKKDAGTKSKLTASLRKALNGEKPELFSTHNHGSEGSCSESSPRSDYQYEFSD
ncbi:hypothetical protein DSO57_1017699 [Entomophthora muscae]|uniref:Uncharacterized protein n=1 Tax=Entomophthora muscae TaxID=34485 RepID=A0ACC2U376_9FUNG|nr:hypothetical protein DSO57_1017699 [Entomophthora muscae]